MPKVRVRVRDETRENLDACLPSDLPFINIIYIGQVKGLQQVLTCLPIRVPSLFHCFPLSGTRL